MSAAQEVSSPQIIITDTLCTCGTPSGRIFNCKSLTRTLPRRNRRRGNRQPADATEYRRRTRTAIEQYLDSAGYFHPVWDTVSPVWSLSPGNRAVVSGERIECTPAGATDPVSLPQPPAAAYPYNAAVIRNRAESLVQAFTQNGYPFASVTVDLQTPQHPDSLIAVFYIDAEKKYLFAPPRLQGAFATREPLLRRDLAVLPGASFDSRAIGRSIDRLNSRRYIAAAMAGPPVVETDTITVAGRERHERVAVPFIITDRSGLGLDGAAALEARSGETPLIHGAVQFNFTNLFHTGEEALLAYTGDRFRQRLDISYSRPWLFGLPFTADAGGGLEVVSDAYGYIYGNLGLFFEPALRWHTGVNLTAHTVSREETIGTPGTSTYTGADLVLSRSGEPPGDGKWSRELTMTTGSGFTRKDRTYNRSHIDFSAGVHLPLPRHVALLMRGVTGHIISREPGLVAAELYRTGGNRSLRGYREDEFAFRTVLYGQTELLYYFQSQAAVFLFSDGGLGFTSPPGPDVSSARLLGYGLGVRVPAGIGTLSVEWARNIRDVKSPGRIHVGFRNSFASATGTTSLSTGIK